MTWNARPRQIARIALNMCPDCGEHESAPGGLRCVRCRNRKNREHRAKYAEARAAGVPRYSPERYSVIAAGRRQHRALQIAAGLCIDCSNPTGRFQRCTPCRAKAAVCKSLYRKGLQVRRAKLQAHMVEGNICSRCSKRNSEVERIYCKRCLNYMSLYDDKRSKARKVAYKARKVAA
jgi:hypothetical protein